jgi:hypothetical protein
MNIIQINEALFAKESSECYKKKRCMIAISARINEKDVDKVLLGEFYTIQLFSSDI